MIRRESWSREGGGNKGGGGRHIEAGGRRGRPGGQETISFIAPSNRLFSTSNVSRS